MINTPEPPSVPDGAVRPLPRVAVRSAAFHHEGCLSSMKDSTSVTARSALSRLLRRTTDTDTVVVPASVEVNQLDGSKVTLQKATYCWALSC